MSPLRDLLVVAFHYPPDNSSTGVLRTLKFTRYLLDHGWRSHVLTVTPEHYRNRDEALLEQVPEAVTVTRVPFHDVRERFSIHGRYPGLIAQPDPFWTWRRPALRAAGEILRRHRVRAVFSTYPVPTAHLIGRALAGRTGLPWVADFRDPWAGGEVGLQGRIDRFFEGRVVRRASRVLANTETARRDFLARYPDLPEDRFVTLPNGYDEEDFAGLAPAPTEPRRFTIAYVGSVDPYNRDPRPLLRAVGRLVREGRLPRDDLRLLFLGVGRQAREPWLETTLEQEGLGAVTERIAERIPYRNALARLAGSDLLVVLNQPQSGDASFWRLMVPAKVYEYLRLGRPLLALVGEGAVVETLAELGVDGACDPADTDAIAARVERAYRAYRDGRRGIDPPPGLARFERRALSARLAALLDELSG